MTRLNLPEYHPSRECDVIVTSDDVIRLVIILGSVGAALAVGILVLFLILMRTKRIEREYSPVNVIFEENSIQVRGYGWL